MPVVNVQRSFVRSAVNGRNEPKPVIVILCSMRAQQRSAADAFLMVLPRSGKIGHSCAASDILCSVHRSQAKLPFRVGVLTTTVQPVLLALH